MFHHAIINTVNPCWLQGVQSNRLPVQQVNATLIYMISAIQLPSDSLASLTRVHADSIVITCIMQGVLIITVVAVRAGLE